MRRFLSALMLGAVLATPVVVRADQHDEHRYYDAEHKDYHEWNEAEERAYHHWLVDVEHRRYHEWAKATAAEQRAYWHWRHEHQDWH